MINKLLTIILPIFFLGIGSYSSTFKIETNDLFNDLNRNVLKDSDNQIILNPTKQEIDKEIENLTIKTTYLLLGNTNNEETELEYYNRYQDYLNLRYSPTIPKDKTTISGYDEQSQEYKDDIVSGITLPTIFKEINEKKPIYNSYENIQIYKNDKYIMSSISIPKVQYKEENPKNRKEYQIKESSLTMYYFYKKQKSKYKLYYLYGEFSDDLKTYFKMVEDLEEKKEKIVSNYYKKINNVYSYNQLDKIKKSNIKDIYEKNNQKVVYLTSNSGNQRIEANGFFIKKSYIITSNKFIRDALKKGEQITIRGEDTIYNFESITSSDEENDIAIIKIKEDGPGFITISEKRLEIENPVFLLSSKTGIKNILEKGIIIADDSQITTTIPYTSNSMGGLLLDQEGNGIGLVSYQDQNNSSSIIKPQDLKSIQESINPKNVKTFKELKEEYYIDKNQEKVISSVPKRVWNQYKIIGNIEKSINLKLVKSSYQENVLSLRYQNEIADHIDSMVFAATFIDNLKKDDYKEIISSPEKRIYQNKKYKIIISKEFNYLVIIMVKL